MHKKHLKWLYGELPDLVERGIVPADAAERIRQHYGADEEGAGRRTALTVCSILGALLIGSGIILLLAHNWEGLSRPVRTVLALTPLVVAQGLGAFILWKGKESVAWRESVGLGITLAIAASIALVGQTYHIPGNLGSFLLTWTLLTLPVMYLLSSALPCVIYLAGITGWAGYQLSESGYPVFFWLLLAPALAYVYMESRRNPYSPRASGLGWALSICLCIGTGLAMEHSLPGLWMIVYSGLLATMYLTGQYWFSAAPTARQAPYHAVGALGIVILALVLTYEDVWRSIGWHYYRHRDSYHGLAATVDYVLTAALPIAAISLLVTGIRRGRSATVMFGAMPIVAIIGFALANTSAGPLAAILLMNAYLLALGIHTMIMGIRNRRLGIVNGGMLIITTLIVARFFDGDFDFAIRGLTFIGIGIGFLVTNIVLAKRMKGGTHAP